MVVYNQESMEISVNVDELDVDYLEVGMPVTVYRSTSSDVVYYQGELTYLSLEATSGSSGVSTFAATITITPLEGEAFDLSSGVTVYYTIDTGGGGRGGDRRDRPGPPERPVYLRRRLLSPGPGGQPPGGRHRPGGGGRQRHRLPPRATTPCR